MKGKIEEVKEDLDVEKKSICVADAGYHSEIEIIEAVKDEKIAIYIPHPRDVKTKEKKEERKKIRYQQKNI